MSRGSVGTHLFLAACRVSVNPLPQGDLEQFHQRVTMHTDPFAGDQQRADLPVCVYVCGERSELWYRAGMRSARSVSFALTDAAAQSGARWRGEEKQRGAGLDPHGLWCCSGRRGCCKGGCGARLGVEEDESVGWTYRTLSLLCVDELQCAV